MPYDNSNSGILSRNERKQQPNHPDFRGLINVEGAEYELSAWIKVGKAGGKMEGRKYFSLSVRRKEQPKPAANTPPPANQVEDEDQDVPF